MENKAEFLVTSFKVHPDCTPGRQKSLSHLIVRNRVFYRYSFPLISLQPEPMVVDTKSKTVKHIGDNVGPKIHKYFLINRVKLCLALKSCGSMQDIRG